MEPENIWSLEGTSGQSQRRRAQTTIYLLKPNNADIILDIGCSVGFMTARLLSSDLTVGIDTSRNSLLEASRRVNHPKASFINADAAHLPFRSNVFTKITLLEVLEHLSSKAQNEVCHQADRVLRQDGSILISVPFQEKIESTRCVHCGKSTPLWGHLESMNKAKITDNLPKTYVLKKSCHLINISSISLSSAFSKLPFRVWLSLNNAFGKIQKGYWIMLNFQKKD